MFSFLAILIFFSLLNLLIGLLVFYRNYKNPANIAFALTCFNLVIWAGLNFFATYVNSSYTLTVTRFTGFFGVLFIFSCYILALVFPNVLSLSKKYLYFLITFAATVSFLSLTDLFIANATNTTLGLKLSEGKLYPLYPLFIMFIFVLINVNFIRQYKHAKKIAKSQIKLIWIGILTTLFLIILSNIIVPQISSSWSSSQLGTVFALPFVAITAYAILARRIFDVRLIVTRTIAYAITITIFASFYSFIIILIATHLFANHPIDTRQLLILVIPVLFIALTFNTIHRKIDILTRRIFYKDALDIRIVLDRLSDVLLLSENDIDTIMKDSLNILSEALKPVNVYLAVQNASGVIYKQLEIGNSSIKNINAVLSIVPQGSDFLTDRNAAISKSDAKIMDSNGLELILRLGSTESPAGILALGVKRNGSIYTKQDLALLEIATKNLGVALDNAKKYEQIIHFATTLRQEVKHATQHLRNANTKLKSLDALKNDFIATASHQLRSPAISVHDALQMLNYPNISNTERKEMLVLAEASSERLVTVVRTMLNMARIQAGHFTVDKSEADMVELVRKELVQVNVLAEQKNIKLEFMAPSKPIVVFVDVAKIKEAMANYLENAIKYSLADTKIKINLFEENDDMVVFEVTDQGMGVPEAERSKLFGRFYRASNARTEEPDGNGIGLYVIKTIAEGHGGQAYYKPGEPSGSVFGFNIKKTSLIHRK